MPLAFAADFTGPVACAECHQKQYQSQHATHHATSLRPIANTPLAQLLTREPLRDRNGATYTYRPVDKGVEVALTTNSDAINMILEWTFGAGSKGFTAVGRLGDKYVEHRVSWYRENNRLGLTPGHPSGPPPDPVAALGVVQTPQNVSRCFGCHASGVEANGDLSRMQPGVTCERCHGAGSEHIARAKAGLPVGSAIFSPAHLSPRAQVQICAQCHRSPNSEFQSDMPELEDPISIRFAPVGFQASQCFTETKTFTCTTCHDPHADPRPASDPFYTNVCLTCHTDAPKIRKAGCKRALKQNCIQCHMKSAQALPNLSFTDHRIRVYVD